MFETINRGPTKAILSGCGAVLLGWAGFLYFFTSKDNPYELGWLFMLLGFAGVCVAAALSGLVIAGIVRARGAFAFSSRVIVMLACPFMPLLGWTGALGMAYTDATPGSVFMFWALVFSISGFLAPLAAAGQVRFQKRAAVEAGRADDASEKRPSSHPVAVYGAAGAPGLIAAVLFALAGNFQYDRFFYHVAGAYQRHVRCLIACADRRHCLVQEKNSKAHPWARALACRHGPAAGFSAGFLHPVRDHLRHHALPAVGAVTKMQYDYRQPTLAK